MKHLVNNLEQGEIQSKYSAKALDKETNSTIDRSKIRFFLDTQIKIQIDKLDKVYIIVRQDLV